VKVAIAVPTLNAGLLWVDWIEALLVTGVAISDIYIVDSGSDDNTVNQSRDAGFNVKEIKPGTFNHGGTRQLIVESLTAYDVVVFLTQDAVLASPDAIKLLVNVFANPVVGAAYGRQLPRAKSTHIEAHARLFNYPEKSRMNSLEDVDNLGIKTAFMSNSFAAYRISALQEVGGFPENTIVSEDMYVAAKMIIGGWKIAYRADATVFHSHGYTMFQEFQRYFDIGVFNARELWIRQRFGNAESEGGRFVRSEIAYLVKKNPFLLPGSLLRTLLKLLGYRLGVSEAKIPVFIKVHLSMQKAYWK